MKTLLPFFVFWCVAVCTRAQLSPTPDLTLTTGQTFKQVKVMKHSPMELRIVHSDGIATVPLDLLPPEWVKEYGTPNPALAAELKAREAVEMAHRAAAMPAPTATAAPAQPENASGPDARQMELARRYAVTTGQSYEVCLQAVMTWDWCVAHPGGGVVNGVTYDAAATAQQLAMAKRALMTPEQLRTAQFQAAQSGPLSTRPATPSGRSANDPQRIAETLARRQRQAGGAGVVAAGGVLIESSIDGEFSGFEGEKVFKLLNGQVWQQTEFHIHIHYAYFPRVMIYPGNGGMMMKVDGVEKAVKVMQLR